MKRKLLIGAFLSVFLLTAASCRMLGQSFMEGVAEGVAEAVTEAEQERAAAEAWEAEDEDMEDREQPQEQPRDDGGELLLQGVVFRLPDGWIRAEEYSGSNVELYYPAEADLADQPSNMTMEVQKSPRPAPKKEELDDEDLMDVVKMVAARSAENLQLGDWLEVPAGDVFTASYEVDTGSVTITQTVHIILADYYNIVVYATNYGDGINPEAAAEELLGSIRLP